MREHLLQAVLALIDQIESAIVPPHSILHFPPDQLARLIAEKILYKGSDASEIPRPGRFPPGPDLTVVRTAKGIEGVAGEGDYFSPVQLTEEDVRQYEVSLPHLVDAIRRDSGVEGNGYHNDNGLIFVGQKPVAGVGIVDVYFSAPNSNEDSVMARCQRLIGIASERRVVLLTPGVLNLAGEDRRILDRIVTISLMTAAVEGHLKANWDQAFVSAATVGPGPSGPDLERLIQGKERVDIATAARYLQRSRDPAIRWRLLPLPRTERHARRKMCPHPAGLSGSLFACFPHEYRRSPAPAHWAWDPGRPLRQPLPGEVPPGRT